MGGPWTVTCIACGIGEGRHTINCPRDRYNYTDEHNWKDPGNCIPCGCVSSREVKQIVGGRKANPDPSSGIPGGLVWAKYKERFAETGDPADLDEMLNHVTLDNYKQTPVSMPPASTITAVERTSNLGRNTLATVLVLLLIVIIALALV